MSLIRVEDTMRQLFIVVTAMLTLAPGAGLSANQARQSSRSASAPTPTASAVMTNQEVIKMTRVGLSSEIIIGAIASAPHKSFDLDPEGLIALKAAGVNDGVIRAMQGAVPSATPASSPAPISSRSSPARTAAEPEEAGLYVKLNGTMTQLEPSVFSQAKTGGVFTSALTYGIKKIKWKAAIRGPRANQRVDGRSEFYFYFENKNSGLSNTGGFAGFIQGASSPNEFVLVRLAQNEKERSLVMGEFGAFGASSGTRSEDTLEFKIEKLAPGTYRVVPGSLVPGEYAFFYAAGASALGAGTTGKLFDFGVD
jgi:hypothetical protein